MAIKVLLADDDYLVLEDLKGLVDWDGLGFHIVGTAKNGGKALALAKKEKPQLVLTDVQMPGMDGLTFLEELRKVSEDTRVIIISSFDNIDYVRRALRGGAVDYLLKNEINAETLTEKLQEMQQRLQRSSDQEATLARILLREYMQTLEPLHVLAGRHPVNDHLLSALAETVDRKLCWYLVTFRWPLTRPDFRSEGLKSDGSALLDAFRNMREEFDPAAISFYIYDMLFIGSEPGEKKNAYNIKSAGERLAKRFAATFGREIVCFYYPSSERLSRLRMRLSEMIPLLEYYSVFPGQGCMDLRAMEKENCIRVREQFDDALLPYVSEESEARLQTALRAHIKTLDDARDMEALGRFYLHICDHLEEMGAAARKEERFFDNATAAAEDLLARYHALAGADVKMQEVMPRSGVVARAVEYIKQHYGEADLSLEQIATAAGLSTGRLSVVFKQETGKTVVEYLTDERMRRALYLLKNTNLKIYEVALATGYGSSQYFSKVFYKKTGKRPIDFK